MAAEHPIPDDLKGAFYYSIRKLRDWRRYGGTEPQIPLDDNRYSIGAIAGIVLLFEDQMPDGTAQSLVEIAGYGQGPDGNTFAAGARCLLRLYEDVRRREEQR
jgi:hypothetical protein